MAMKRLKHALLFALCGMVFNLGMPAPVLAAPPVDKSDVKTVSANRLSMSLTVGKSRIYKPRESATRISVADPAVADVMLLNPGELYILGKKTGNTNIFIWHDQERMSVIDVSVGVDTVSAKDLFARLMPAEHKMRVSAAGDTLVLSGQVSDATRVQQAIQIAEELSGKKVLNMLTTEDLPQVLLEVKVAEIDRTVLDSLGLQMQGSNFTFNMLGGPAPVLFGAAASVTSGSTTSWLQAQMNSGLVKVLAEPNIMAISGQEGQFLSGGKVFLPVPQSSSSGGLVVTLQEENYGVGIKFTPTVLGGGRINLKVRPEVSQLSPNGVTITAQGNTTVMPQITTRQASTTVQLYDGQSLAIGGLIGSDVIEVVSAFPMLANIPIIGALFRSASFNAKRSELLIVVTPRIVKPLQAMPPLPTDNYKQPSAPAFFLGGVMEGEYKLPEPPADSTNATQEAQK
jgi:pilus assembly protein CpaC